MAHFWVQNGADNSWAIAPLEGGSPWEYSGDPIRPFKRAASRVLSGRLRIVFIEDLKGSLSQGGSWVLLSPPETRVLINDFPVFTGIRVLQDRDEIRIPVGTRLYFSSETPAKVVPFPKSEKTILCPRCKEPILVGVPAVRCPQPRCGLWHHQIESDEPTLHRPCWTYANHCARCDQPTELGQNYRWTPEVL